MTIYKDLVTAGRKYHKNIYVLASHAHYVANNILNTPYWQKNGEQEGIKSGWIVGTAGARFYQLPEGVPSQPKHRMANVYGYLLSTVGADSPDRLQVSRVREADIRAALAPGYRDALVQFCVEQTANPTERVDLTFRPLREGPSAATVLGTGRPSAAQVENRGPPFTNTSPTAPSA